MNMELNKVAVEWRQKIGGERFNKYTKNLLPHPKLSKKLIDDAVTQGLFDDAQENKEYSTLLIEENKALEKKLRFVNTYVEYLEEDRNICVLKNKKLKECLSNLGLSLDEIPYVKMGNYNE